MDIVDAMIPVWKPDGRLERCVEMLQEQSRPIRNITLILSVDKNSKEWVRRVESRFGETSGIEIKKIEKEHFNHGGTRHAWAAESDADVLLFMVQDAVPADREMVRHLTESLKEPENAVAYARHVPDGRCDAVEAFTRYFTYPPKSRVKKQEDVEKYGIEGCFTSNVCAAYRRDWYEKTGGFERLILLSEDSVFAARALACGASIVYCAKARIIHAHCFSCTTQWKRNFDIGVVHKKYGDVFGNTVPEKRGATLIKETAGYLIKHGKAVLLPRLFWMGVVKAVAYTAGKQYKRLPVSLVKRWTLDKAYWEET